MRFKKARDCFIKRLLPLITTLLFSWSGMASTLNKVVNVYTWSDEIPSHVIKQFEHETGIKVNYSSFDTNEVMFAKLRANKNSGFDLIEPSSFYIDRMRRLNLLEKLDRSQLSNFANLDPFFLKQPSDPDSQYSVPFIWGVTGIFYNKHYFSNNEVAQWSDLINEKYKNQLMFLDDSRETFSMALRLSGYSINDTNKEHVLNAYEKLKTLAPNIRLFNSDAVASLLIDEDATIGMAWNGDLYKAKRENPELEFVFPKDGFEIWVDNFALLKDAPHKENAYKFLNFLMRPDIAKEVSLNINYSSANLAARKLMPPEVQNNPVLYPSEEVLRRGEFQRDIGDKGLALYEKYWEQLKMGG
jgi:spermidine/putrescine transport system substrate-binding protein